MRIRGIIVSLLLVCGIVFAGGNGHRTSCYIIPPVSGTVGGQNTTYPPGAKMLWRYDNSNEWASGIISDLSGNGNTNVQATSTKRGSWMNPGVLFDGSDDVFNFRTNAVPLGPFSVNIWYSTPNLSVVGRVFMGWYTSTAPYDDIRLTESTAGSANSFQMTATGVVVVSISSEVPASNTLHCYTATFETNNANIYLDGILQQSDASCTYNPTNRTWGAATIGCLGPGLYHCKSIIYGGSVWHRGLSSNEVWAVYSLGRDAGP